MKKSFGERLKEARNEKKLKQSELAKQLGVKNTTISNWENNISKPDLDMLSYICGALGVKVSYFLDAKIPEDDVTIQEFELIKKYRALDDHGREMVDFTLKKEWERSSAISEIQNDIIDIPEHLSAKAAHERTDIEVTEEMRQHDDDIMNDDSEWE